MMLARAIHFDESDMNIFHSPARTGEWCISGGFEFSNWSEADLTGKARQAFSNGWLGGETFGRASVVAITQIEPAELDALTAALAQHFVDLYGAPSLADAQNVAREELMHIKRSTSKTGVAIRKIPAFCLRKENGWILYSVNPVMSMPSA